MLVSVLLLPNVFATDKKMKKNYSAQAIGTVPEKYQKMVNENWAIAKGKLSDDGYYRIDTEKRKVILNNYNIYGEKIYQSDYHYRHAGKDNFGLNYRYNINVLRDISDDGSAYITSHTLRSLILFNINLPSKSVLVKVNSKGEVLWKYNLNRKNGDMFFSVIEAPDGKVIASSTKSRKLFGDMDMSESTSSLILLDSNGDLIYSKNFEDGIMLFNNIVCVEDKGFFAIGTKYSKTQANSSLSTQGYLCALDYDFNILWSYEIERIINDWDGKDVLEKGYPVIISADPYPYRANELTIARIDFDKNIVSKHTFKTENDKEFITQIYFLNNGEYILEYENDQMKHTHGEQVKCGRFSSDSKKIDDIALTGYGVHNIIETENERIFCCWNALTYTDNGNVDERECVYTAFDKDWNLLWQKSTAEKGTVIE